MMDEVFGEENRIGIINWQKSYSPKNDAKSLSKTTEYVLVYANDLEIAQTELLKVDRKNVRNQDNDPIDDWVPKDPTARQNRSNTAYAMQSPFTGNLHYPNGEYSFDGRLPEARSHWVNFTKDEARKMLEEWGSEYELRDLGDGRGPALVLKGSKISLENYNPANDEVVQAARKRAFHRREAGSWPVLYFRADKARNPALGRPRLKAYIREIREGKIPTTFWDEDFYDTPLELGAVTWTHTESGHTDLAKRELDAIVGTDHGFDTVKPLRLMKKIVQIWCPPEGLVMDPYAGSGTTGHAVLELNKESGSARRFILIEQGCPDHGDKYARSLTYLRLKNAVSGERPNKNGEFTAFAEPLGGGFEFRMLTKQIDAKTVLTMKRDELVDVIITSHWESAVGSRTPLMLAAWPNTCGVFETAWLLAACHRKPC